MGIEGAFISINIKSSERKSSMLEKSMGKSALMVALVTGNVIWGGTQYPRKNRIKYLR